MDASVLESLEMDDGEWAQILAAGREALAMKPRDLAHRILRALTNADKLEAHKTPQMILDARNFQPKHDLQRLLLARV